MRRNIVTHISFIGLATVLVGCQSHQAKVDSLRKDHDRLSQQYQKHCGAEYLKAKPQFSQKCIDEAKQMDDMWKQLQQERTK